MSGTRWAACALVVAWMSGCGPRPERQLELVRIAQAEGRYAESIDGLRRVLDATPDAPEASYLLGVALRHTGRPGEALWPLLRAAESREFAAAAGLQLARTLLETGNHEAAVRAASDALAAAPGDADGLLIRARALLAVRRPTEALVDVEAAVAASTPEAPDAFAVRAAVLLALERSDEARRDLERAALLGSRSGDAAAAARSCLARAAFEARIDAAGESARSAIQDCVERFPGDLSVLRAASDLHDAASRPDEATRLWRAALERTPESLPVRAALAARLEEAGPSDEAAALWRQTAERVDTALAWQLLADHERRRGRHAEAKTALARAVERSEGSGDELRFAEADLLIDLGELDRAQERIAALEDATLRQLLQGRVDLARGDPARALAALDAGILAWPNNPAARMLAGQAAAQLGDTERALAEYRAAFRAGGSGDAAGLVAARLHLALGERDSALHLVAAYLSRHPDAGPEPYLLLARAHAELGAFGEARRVLERVRAMGGDETALLLERARIAEREAGPAAAAALLRESGLDWSDAARDPVLGVIVDRLAAAGESAAALAILDGALGGVERASLHDLRGRVLLRAGRDRDAQAAFERARALDPGSARARVGLAMVAARAGNLRLAARHLDAALEADDLDAGTRYGAAQILLLAGRVDEAIRQLERLLRAEPGHARACAELARLLAERSEALDRALSLAERAVRIDPGEPERESLAFVQQRVAAARPGR